MSTRAEIDTSAPFHSVKEAVTRFGGIGFWKPSLHSVADIELQKDLVLKERETLDVLKEVDGTKTIIEETFEANEIPGHKDDNETTTVNEEDKENQQHNVIGSLSCCPPSAPGPILTELKQAKLNLSRTTSDLAGIRASVESLTRKLDKERSYLEKTKERLPLNSLRMSNLEKELNDTILKLQVAKDAEAKISSFDNISKEIQRLSSKAEDFKKLEEVSRDDVSRAIAEVEQMKASMKTVELRLVAARKMKQAARATEAVALSELNKGLSIMSRAPSNDGTGVSISYEEYSALTCKAQDAEELGEKKVVHALDQVHEADVSNIKVLRKVENATEEVTSCKKALEEALCRVEAANKAKLGVEEALREWRAEHSHRRRSSVNKFNHACASQNGLNLVSDEMSIPVLKPTLSIGQILSPKLQLPEDLEREILTGKGKGKLNMSLGQVLSKQACDLNFDQKNDRESNHKQLSGKRKKSGLARFSLFSAKESNRKNKPTINLS